MNSQSRCSFLRNRRNAPRIITPTGAVTNLGNPKLERADSREIRLFYVIALQPYLLFKPIVVKMTMPYAFKLLTQELVIMNVATRIVVGDEFEGTREETN